MTSHGKGLAKTNDDGGLPIRTDAGDRVLAFDFPAFRVGIAEYPDGPTGTTVLHFPDGATAALDVSGRLAGGDRRLRLRARHCAGRRIAAWPGGRQRGGRGAAGARRLPRPLQRYPAGQRRHRVRLRAARQQHLPGQAPRARRSRRRRAGGRFPLGARGAGSSVSVGNGISFDRGERSGQGAAFRDIGGVKVFACVVLNAVGGVFDRTGTVVRGNLDPHTGRTPTGSGCGMR